MSGTLPKKLLALAVGWSWAALACEADPSPRRVVSELEDAGPADPDVSEGPGPSRWHGLPLIDVRVDPGVLAELDRRTPEDEAIEPVVAVRLDGRVYEGVTIELHGGIARKYPKRSYRLTFNDDDKPELTLFSEAPETHRRVVLQASFIDPSFLRQGLTFDLLRALGAVAPRTGFVGLAFNGRAHGLYVAIERIDRLFLDRQGFDPDGNVYKAINHSANWAPKAEPMDGFHHKVNEENPTDDLGELLGALGGTPATFADFEAEVAPRLSLADFRAFHLAHTLAMNADTYTKNYYLYHDLQAPPGTPAARFRIISWDADATWGQKWEGSPLPPDADRLIGTDRFAPRLFSISEHWRTYLQAYAAALEGPGSAATLLAGVDAAASEMADAARADHEAWAAAREAEGYPAPDFDAELARVRAAVEARVEVMRGAVREARGAL
jgi:spore coat protein H